MILAAWSWGGNTFYGQGFNSLFGNADQRQEGATVDGYRVSDPECFGVVAFDDKARAASVEKKPALNEQLDRCPA